MQEASLLSGRAWVCATNRTHAEQAWRMGVMPAAQESISPILLCYATQHLMGPCLLLAPLKASGGEVG